MDLEKTVQDLVRRVEQIEHIVLGPANRRPGVDPAYGALDGGQRDKLAGVSEEVREEISRPLRRVPRYPTIAPGSERAEPEDRPQTDEPKDPPRDQNAGAKGGPGDEPRPEPNRGPGPAQVQPAPEQRVNPGAVTDSGLSAPVVPPQPVAPVPAAEPPKQA